MGGEAASRFEDGLRFLATALALREDRRAEGAAVTAACDAVRCFLAVLQAGARRHLPDPDGRTERLRAQCEALLSPAQGAQEALEHALEAARLSRDRAARVLVDLAAEGRP